MARRRLLDIDCTPYNFTPGTRLLVHLHETLDLPTLKRLEKTIRRWAGESVEILIVDDSVMSLEVVPNFEIPGQD